MFEDYRIKLFLTVASEESFTRAAEKLGITQPAVSQNIAELEKGFNVKLFERRRGSVALTGEGRVFEAYARRLSRSYAELDTVFTHFEELNGIRLVKIAMSVSLLGTLPQIILPYVSTVCPNAAVLFTSGEDGTADLTITEEGGVRSFRPSASFALNPLYGLLRGELLSR